MRKMYSDQDPERMLDGYYPILVDRWKSEAREVMSLEPRVGV